WEGSGNVICLDVLRAIARDPLGARRLLAHFAGVAGAEPALAAAVQRLQQALSLPEDAAQAAARGIAQDVALLAQASLLREHAPAAVADAFVARRFAPQWGRTYGVLPAGADVDAILARALPML